MKIQSIKSCFEQVEKRVFDKQTTKREVFELEQLKHLPLPMQRFFVFSGLIGRPIMKASRTIHTDVRFVLNEGKPNIKIKYIQHNYTHEPERLAFIDTKIHGIPFQGIDSYIDGIGGMKGVLVKFFCLFDQKGKEMNQASLVTVLAESIVCPSAFLMDYITWEAIDDTHARATITYYGISASGLFTFSKEGAILSFKTNERYSITTDGHAVCTPWTAECGNYIERDGIPYPTSFKGIWNREQEDFVYFDCNQVEVEYRY